MSACDPVVTVTSSAAPLAEVRPAGDAVDVSFVLVAYGTGSIIVDGLASLVASIADDAISYECIVVDNEHPMVPRRTIRELELSTSGVRVVRPGWNTGFGGGCELGALHARGDVLAFVNPDVVFEPGWLPPLLAALDDPTVSIAGPVLFDRDGTVQEAGRSLGHDGHTHAIVAVPDDDVADRDYFSAACWLLRRDEHERIGGFDPAYHPAYYEDVDLALRARSAGGRCVVVAASRVEHWRGSSTADSSLPDLRPQIAELMQRWPSIAWRHAEV